MNIVTGVVQIGNSDDKLGQQEWAMFIAGTWTSVQLWAKQIHFEGYAMPSAAWQNACWVFEIDAEDLKILRADLRKVAKQYRQDSIALTVGITEFVPHDV